MEVNDGISDNKDQHHSISSAKPTEMVHQSQESQSQSLNKSSERHPLIKFVGKRSLLSVHTEKMKTSSVTVGEPLASPTKKVTPTPLPSASKKELKKEGNGASFHSFKNPAFLGRPKFSQREIDAIASGGAEEVEC
jgi:hypothetical protein